MLDGELRELDRNKRSIVNPVEVYGQLKFICNARGYKPGWAYHKATEYFGGIRPIGFDAAPPFPRANSELGEIAAHRLRQGAGSITVVQKPHKGRTGIGRLKTGQVATL